MPATISIRLLTELTRRLNELARDLERPRTFIIRKALESYLSEQAYYQIAFDRLRDKDDGIISSDAVRRALGR